MSRNDMKCPYCGEKMRLEADSVHIWMKCENCLSCSPKAERPGYKEHEASAVYWFTYWNKCEEIAKKASLSFLRQKPLTLKKLRMLIDHGEEAVVYCETKQDKKETYGTIFFNGKIFDRYGKAPGPRNIRYETYGKTWRAWAARPTDEERAAAQWEE